MNPNVVDEMEDATRHLNEEIQALIESAQAEMRQLTEARLQEV